MKIPKGFGREEFENEQINNKEKTNNSTNLSNEEFSSETKKTKYVYEDDDYVSDSDMMMIVARKRVQKIIEKFKKNWKILVAVLVCVSIGAIVFGVKWDVRRNNFVYEYSREEDAYYVKSFSPSSYEEYYSIASVIKNKPVIGIKAGVFAEKYNYYNTRIKVFIPKSITVIEEPILSEVEKTDNSFNSYHAISLYCEATTKPQGWCDNWYYTVENPNEENYEFSNIHWAKKFFVDSNVRYLLDLSNKSATILKHTNRVVKSVNILSEIEGCALTKIGDSAFEYCSNLESIELPSSVTSIGDSAFSHCLSLKSIGNTSGVISIGSSAFYNCSSLESIELQSGVTSIGNSAFEGCSSLKSIELQSGVTSIGNSAFRGCSSLESIELQSGVTSIGSYTFSGCSSLKSIELPSGVTSIGDSAFRGCSSLESIELQSGLTSIGDYAFEGCSSLQNLEIPDSVTQISYCVFKGCSSLQNIRLPNFITQISQSAFEDCSSLQSIEIPNSVTTIGYSAFEGCSSLESIELPSSITSISSYAFKGCSNLQSIEIPYSITDIGRGAFEGCEQILYNIGSLSYVAQLVVACEPTATNAQIMQGAKFILADAFNDCANLISVSIPNTVIRIDSNFYYCSNLQEIIVDENNQYYKSIDGNLYTKDGKTLINYASGKTQTRFSIPSGVIEIGKYAFQNNQNLISLELSDTVCNIPNGSQGWSINKIKEFLVDENNPYYKSIDGNLYTKDGKTLVKYANGKTATTFTVPRSVVTVTPYAIYDLDLVELNIPYSVTQLNYGFAHCNNLKTINYDGTVAQWQAFRLDISGMFFSYDTIINVKCIDGSLTIQGDGR